MEEAIWGRRIRAFRKLKGFTQEQLAADLGVSVSYLGDIERGSKTANEQFIMKVAEALAISLEDLRSIN